MKKLFATTLNAHDSNWYDGDIHWQAERHTRHKQNMYPGDRIEFYNTHFKPYLEDKETTMGFTYTLGGLSGFTDNDVPHPLDTDLRHMSDDINHFNHNIKNLWDYLLDDNVYYINHHQSHAAYALLSSGYDEADILAVDGGGVMYWSTFFDKDGTFFDLTEEFPIGPLWNFSARVAGIDTCGKLMGRVAYGKFDAVYNEFLNFMTDEIDLDDKIDKTLLARAIKYNFKPEDIAFTVQQFTYERINDIIERHKTSNNIVIAGGVGYNGYMNEYLGQLYDNVHVAAAPGDEGQSIGTYMHMDYTLNNNKHIPGVYNGIEHDIDESIFEGLIWKKLSIEEATKEAALAVSNGEIIGWWQGRSESGNRSLGNRSIVADPRNPDIKDIINKDIKRREDWRPFAPSVLEEHYKEYFDTPVASPYMSRITKVISDKIPGVTHVDGTARIQTVNIETNERWYNLINEFYKLTGIPLVVNTSFNCREPIVESPQDAVNTFMKTKLDLLVVGEYVVRKGDIVGKYILKNNQVVGEYVVRKNV
jgi:carbamoyltransferase|tara:strand:- start:624 stop:2219 length:1596 start_codon:yes stop_codon:yes gene_type:complete